MPFLIVRNDITRMTVDAIVNAANNRLEEGRGVCGAIFAAAGSSDLTNECRKIGSCETGKAVITGGYNLPAKYIIHTPGPVWSGGENNESKLLKDSYNNSLLIAKKHNLESIAFPLISSGVYGYPTDKAFALASSVIKNFLQKNEMTVYLVLYDSKSFNVGKKAYPDIKEYINENYIPDDILYSRQSYRRNQKANHVEVDLVKYSEVVDEAAIEKRHLRLNETFQEMLFRKIDELGYEEPYVYKKANISRKLFSKIRSNKHYSPSKTTGIALGIALKLSYVEMQELLGKAGYTLSKSILTDVIIEYCLEKSILNIHTINEILFEQTGQCLGS